MGSALAPLRLLGLLDRHGGGATSGDGGGKNWRKDNSGLPGTDVHGKGIDPQNPNVLYAFFVGRGIYRSPDAGRIWELVNAQKNIMGPSLVDPSHARTVYIAEMQGGFQESAEGGQS